MAQQTINVGTAPNDGTGTPLRTAFQYTNSNFSELYTAVGPSGNNIVVPGNATITGDLTVDTNVLKVDTTLNRVGIGTASPSGTIHSAGAAATATPTGGAATGAGLIVSNTTPTYGMVFGVGGGGSGWIQQQRVDGTNTQYDLLLQPIGGRVAIGASTANYPLDVQNNSGTSTRVAIANTANAAFGAGIYLRTLNGGSLVSNASIFTDNAGNLQIYNGTSTESLKATLDASGNLGIGVIPAVKLDIGGAATQQFRIQMSGQADTRVISDTGAGIIGTYSNHRLVIRTNSADAVIVDASQNVGIGVTPSAWGSNYRAVEVSGAVNVFGATSDGNLAGIGANLYHNNTNYLYRYATFATMYLQDNGTHQWHIAPSGTAGNAITFTQAMTLDASGNLLVGTTSSPLASRVSVGVTNAQPDAFVIRNSDATAGLYWRLAYVNSANTFHILNQSGVGVYLTDGATSWTGTSDERLKDIIEPISNAVAKVGSLRSVIGKFKTDSEGTRRSFLIAQDVQAVLPEAVDTTNADAFGVRYSEVIPLLVAAIKELTARVQTLETR